MLASMVLLHLAFAGAMRSLVRRLSLAQRIDPRSC